MIVPAEATKALSIVQKRLQESLVAVYLHGSAATGELRPRSDVDVLVIIDQPMTSETRRHLTSDLMQISGRYPFDADGRRPVELIIFLNSDLALSRHPARSEFIYGEWLRSGYEAGEHPEPVCDAELTLVLAQALREAKPLLGPKASELLPTISTADIRHAIREALPALVKTLPGDEHNVLLTLARMWRTAVTGEFVSKKMAADWAASRLSAEQADVLTDAREAYLTGRDGNWKSRQRELQSTVHTLRDIILMLTRL